MKRVIVPYNKELKERARKLRNNSTRSEVLLWKYLKGRLMKGYDFHRQKPLDEFIVDFYCCELFLAIEIDGSSHIGKEKYDRERQIKIESLGVHFLRFDDLLVKRDVEIVIRTIENWIDEYEKLHPDLPEMIKERNMRKRKGTRPDHKQNNTLTPPAPLKRGDMGAENKPQPHSRGDMNVEIMNS